MAQTVLYPLAEGRRGLPTRARWQRLAVDSNQVRGIQDGPYGATPLKIGGELAGKMITAPLRPDRASWSAVRLSDYSVAQTATL